MLQKLTITSTALNTKSTVTQIQLANRPNVTRKPCYRKDDRAMRPIYGYMP